MLTKSESRKSRGFTLVEVVLAIGVIGVLVVVFVAMFFPARKAVQTALTMRESDRVMRAFTTELGQLRNTERAERSQKESSMTRYISSFDKAFYWMMGTANPGTAIVVYNYKSDLRKPARRDGSPAPWTDDEPGVPGETMEVVTGVCRVNDRTRQDDFKAVVGPAFLVKMTQLVVTKSDRGAGFKYCLADRPGVIRNPYKTGTAIVKPNEFRGDAVSKPGANELGWGAAVAYHAQFYQIFGVNSERLRNAQWSDFKTPVFTRDFVFRR